MRGYWRSIPPSALRFWLCAGFVIATVLLHAAGIGAALGAQKLLASLRGLPLRFAGAAIAICGLMLFIS